MMWLAWSIGAGGGDAAFSRSGNQPSELSDHRLTLAAVGNKGKACSKCFCAFAAISASPANTGFLGKRNNKRGRAFVCLHALPLLPWPINDHDAKFLKTLKALNRS